MFCLFLALLLRKELEDRLGRKGWKLEWAGVVRDLDNLNEMEVAINNKGHIFRGQTAGLWARHFMPAASSCHWCFAHAELGFSAAQVDSKRVTTAFQ